MADSMGFLGFFNGSFEVRQNAWKMASYFLQIHHATMVKGENAQATGAGSLGFKPQDLPAFP